MRSLCLLGGIWRREGKEARALISILVTNLVQLGLARKWLASGWWWGGARPLRCLNIPCVCFPRGLENPGHRVQQERVKLKEVVSL